MSRIVLSKVAGVFQRKSVRVQAVQWRVDNHEQVKQFLGDDYITNLSEHAPGNRDNHIVMRSGVGKVEVHPDMWIVRDVDGQHYAVKNWVFRATYEVPGER